MTQKDPSVDPGRVRAAWSVLMGQRVTPLQIQAEWLEYKMIFTDILERFGAQLGRAAKAEKKRITKKLAAPEATAAPAARSSKQAVRNRAAALGLGSAKAFGRMPQPNGVDQEIEVDEP